MLNIDTDNDLIITRYRNGIKLTPPKNDSTQERSIGGLLKLPFPIYFNSKDEVIINCNESSAEASGWISREDSLGKNCYLTYKKNTIKQSVKNQQDVIQNDKYKIIEDILIRNDDQPMHALSFKMPWYNDENNIIGLFGCSIFLGKQPIAESLSHIANLGLLDQTCYPVTANKIFKLSNPRSIAHLSPREKECLQYYLQNYTAKETAILMGLSYRTVEEYFTNIKKKLGYRYKRDLLNLHNIADWGCL